MSAMVKRVIDLIGKDRMFKLFFNISPMYRRTGGRIVTISPDLKEVKIRLPLNLRTKNYVGTIYGGHMYSAVDGIYMVQLINILGSAYVIWDKSATIRFKKPANTTLYADFILTDKLLDEIKHDVAGLGEKDYILKVDLVDKSGKVYAEVDKVIYIADKNFYNEKKAKRMNKKAS